VGGAHPTCDAMPDYRRAFVPGGTFFLTIVTHERRPLFAEPPNVERLRRVLREIRQADSFEFVAGVVLPDHLHFIWALPRGDADFSRRVGRMKVLFTRSLCGPGNLPVAVSASRRSHRESDVWQRRFWEHTIVDEEDLENHLHYLHYNPVKHALATCPHFWPHSSFAKWVRLGLYTGDWGCACGGRRPELPDLSSLIEKTGE
jgi:putative transposase